MITLREVADEAGVSLSTVSAVLSGQAETRRIAPATRQRVRHAAERLGYSHNALARSLRAGKTNSIGILGYGYPGMHHTLRVEAAARSLTAAGYRVLMQNLAWQRQHEAPILKEMLSLRVDGLLVEGMGGTAEVREILESLARRGFPMVRYDMTDELPVDLVTVDREQGAFEATGHLLALGHRRIACAIPRRASVPVIQDRLRGYRRAHAEWGVPVDDALLLTFDERRQFPGYRVGSASMQRALQLQPRPTALITTDDQVAIGAFQAAYEAGARVPDDIALIGFCGFPEGEYCAVPLTTVAFPFEAIATEAVRMLQERVSGECRDEPPRCVMLKPQLIVRRSCGAGRTPRAVESNQ